MEFPDEIVMVKKPALHLVDSLAEQYSAIAFKFGYFEAQSPCWLYFMRKDGEAAAFEVQFGNISEFKSSLDKLVRSKAQFCFLIMSSRAHVMKPEEARGLLLRNFQIGKQKFLFIDIETGRCLRANFEWEEFQKKMSDGSLHPDSANARPIFREEGRKKKIYGKRGQHKVQD
jgi:hypothetical protein